MPRLLFLPPYSGLSMNPSKQAPLKCPPAYTRAGPADKPLLKAFLSVYFTSSVVRRQPAVTRDTVGCVRD